MGKRFSTKDKLALSLNELLMRRSIEDISVNDICENADLCLRTFYNHFHDKHELVSYLYNNVTEEYWHIDGNILSLPGFLNNCVRDPVLLKNAMLYHGQNNIREEMEQRGVRDLVRLMKLNGYPYEIDDEVENILLFFMCGISRISERFCQMDVDKLGPWLSKYGSLCLPERIVAYLKAPSDSSEK